MKLILDRQERRLAADPDRYGITDFQDPFHFPPRVLASLCCTAAGGNVVASNGPSDGGRRHGKVAVFPIRSPVSAVPTRCLR